MYCSRKEKKDCPSTYCTVGSRCPADQERTAQNKNMEEKKKKYERFSQSVMPLCFFQVRSVSTRYDVGQRHVPAATQPSACAVSLAGQGTGLSQTSSETTLPMSWPHQHLRRAKMKVAGVNTNCNTSSTVYPQRAVRYYSSWSWESGAEKCKATPV